MLDVSIVNSNGTPYEVAGVEVTVYTDDGHYSGYIDKDGFVSLNFSGGNIVRVTCGGDTDFPRRAYREKDSLTAKRP